VYMGMPFLAGVEHEGDNWSRRRAGVLD
jgi:hypothetical protein